MSGGKNQRALLMELLLVVLFFSLCATILLQTFLAARETSRMAGIKSDALTQMQIVSENLCAADDAEAWLASAGFGETEEGWTLAKDGYVLCAVPVEDDRLRAFDLKAVAEDEVLIAWPCVRYLPGEVAP